ncbi:hypothetical protein L210DRAFT_3503950 [Boletus edulis BED1]|uniref:Uncharacterized protein n=1 Tax=Boletus edulis BED1 TaxID=1328754 RepID=A0AAD4BU33_BOLED|nr:hypothetical protein L210DRAFT_3503950 [Boletus edulis BED1]
MASAWELKEAEDHQKLLCSLHQYDQEVFQSFNALIELVNDLIYFKHHEYSEELMSMAVSDLQLNINILKSEAQACMDAHVITSDKLASYIQKAMLSYHFLTMAKMMTQTQPTLIFTTQQVLLPCLLIHSSAPISLIYPYTNTSSSHLKIMDWKSRNHPIKCTSVEYNPVSHHMAAATASVPTPLHKVSHETSFEFIHPAAHPEHPKQKRARACPPQQLSHVEATGSQSQTHDAAQPAAPAEHVHDQVQPLSKGIKSSINEHAIQYFLTMPPMYSADGDADFLDKLATELAPSCLRISSLSDKPMPRCMAKEKHADKEKANEAKEAKKLALKGAYQQISAVQAEMAKEQTESSKGRAAVCPKSHVVKIKRASVGAPHDSRSTVPLASIDKRSLHEILGEATHQRILETSSNSGTAAQAEYLDPNYDQRNQFKKRLTHRVSGNMSSYASDSHVVPVPAKAIIIDTDHDNEHHLVATHSENSAASNWLIWHSTLISYLQLWSHTVGGVASTNAANDSNEPDDDSDKYHFAMEHSRGSCRAKSHTVAAGATDVVIIDTDNNDDDENEDHFTVEHPRRLV